MATAKYSDANGATHLNECYILICEDLNYQQNKAAYIRYRPKERKMYLYASTDTSGIDIWSGGALIGGGIELVNANVKILWSETEATLDEFELFLKVKFSFRTIFDGAKIVYIRTIDEDGVDTGFVQVGTFTVAH